MDFRQTVLEEGMQIFQQNGIKNLTMDTILATLEISKGTLNGFARSKEELLDICVDAALVRRQNHFANLLKVITSPLEGILLLLHANLKALDGHHPDFLSDLKSEHPACWQKMQQFSETIVLKDLTRLFQEGVEQDIFITELDPSLASKLLINQTHSLVETGILDPEANNFQRVFKHAFEHYLRGWLTTNGILLLDAIIACQNYDTAQHLN